MYFMISSELADTFASVSSWFDNLSCHRSSTVVLTRKTFATKRSVGRNTYPDGMVCTSVKGSRCFWMYVASPFSLPIRWPCTTSRTGHRPPLSRCDVADSQQMLNLEVSLKPKDTSRMAAAAYGKHHEENYYYIWTWRRMFIKMLCYGSTLAV